MSDEREIKNPFENDLWNSMGPSGWHRLPKVIYMIVRAGDHQPVRFKSLGGQPCTTSKGMALAEARIQTHKSGVEHIVISYRLDEATLTV